MERGCAEPRRGTDLDQSAIDVLSYGNQLYFGLGNASGGRLPPGTTLRHFEFDDRQARLRVLTRFRLHGPLSLMLGDNYRFEDPHPYAGSRLQSDAAAGVIRGVRPLHLFTQAVGLVFDSRDNEIFPHSGVYGDIGVRTTVGPRSMRACTTVALVCASPSIPRSGAPQS